MNTLTDMDAFAQNDGETAVLPYSLSIPIVSVEALSERVAEGEPARFRITSSGDSSEVDVLTVNFSITTRGDYFTGEEFPSSVQLDNNTAVVEIPTVDDLIAEWSGRVHLDLQSGIGYAPSDEGDNRATVIIESADVARISIEPVASTVVEGAPAQFRIMSTIPFWRHVNLSVELNGDVSTDRTVPTSKYLEGRTEIVLSVPTVASEFNGSAGSVSVSLEDGLLYEVDENFRDPVRVAVVQRPLVTVDVLSERVAEGEPARFRISSSGDSQESDILTVNFSITTRGEYFTGEQFPSSVRLDNNTAVVDIPTVDDLIAEWSGRVHLDLQSGVGYDLSDGGGNRATVIVESADVARISIEPVVARVVEGAPAQFRIMSTIPYWRHVNLSVEREGDFFPDQAVPSSKYLEGKTEVVFSVPTVADDTYERGGSVSVTLEDGVLYEVDENFRDPVSVAVASRHSRGTVPIIDMEIVETPIREGQPARLRFTSSYPTHAVVNVGMRTRGEYFTGPLPTRVEMAGGTEAVLEIPTVNDETNEWSGRIWARLLRGDGYLVAGTDGGQDGAEHELIIEDWDLKYGDAILPRIWVEPSKHEIVEGERAHFIIRSARGGSTLAHVYYSVREVGTMFPHPHKESLYAGTAKLVFKGAERVYVDTVDDDVAEEASRIELTIVGGAGYYIADSPGNKAVITVLDDDNVLSIEAIDTHITEGNDARFRLSFQVPYSGRVDLGLRTSGDYFPREGFPNHVVFDNEREKVFSVPTVDDLTVEWSGRVYARLRAKPGEFALAEDSTGEVEVIVENDDIEEALPVVSLSAEMKGRSTEGGQGFDGFYDYVDFVEYGISIDRVLGGDLTARVEVLTTEGVGLGWPALVTVPAGETESDSLTYTVNQRRSTAAPRNRAVVVRVLPGTGYAPGSEVTVAVGGPAAVSDTAVSAEEISRRAEQLPPQITIEPVAGSVAEGTAAEFRVASSKPWSGRVNVSFELLGDYVDRGGLPGHVEFRDQDELVLSVPTFDDEIVEWPGRVSATLGRGDGYRIAAGSRGEVWVTVESEDTVESTLLPRISLEAVSARIREGKPVRYRVVSNVPTHAVVNIGIRVIEEEYLGDLRLPTTVAMQGRTQVYVDLPTVNDTVPRDNGNVFAHLIRGDGYVLAGTDGFSNGEEVRVEIEDVELTYTEDGGIATMWAEAINEDITEGEDVKFRIRASRDAALVVLFVKYRWGGSMFEPGVKDTLPDPLRFHFQKDVYVTIPTVDDDVVEGNGFMEIELRNKPDDINANWTFYNVAHRDSYNSPGRRARVTIHDDDREFSIRPINDRVVEGSPVRLRVETPVAYTGDIEVSVRTEGDFFRRESLPTVARFDFANWVELSIDTVDDDVSEGEGRVYASLPGSRGYTVANGEGEEVSVVVEDNDSPTVSVTAEIKGRPIGGGGASGDYIDYVEYKVSSDRAPAEDLLVTVEFLTAEGRVLGWNPSVTIPKDQTESQTGSFSLSLRPSTEEPEHESVIVRVRPEGNIIPGGEVTAVPEVPLTVGEFPEISIDLVDEEPIDEGGSAELVLTATAAAAYDIHVSVSAFQQDEFDFLGEGGDAITIVLPAGETTVSHTVTTVDDEVAESDGPVAFEISAGEGYSVGETATVSLQVLDNDSGTPTGASGQELALAAVDDNQFPEVTIEPSKDSGTEGEDFGFDFSISPEATEGFSLIVEVTQEGEFIGDPVAASDRGAGRTELAVSPGTGTVSLNVLTVNDVNLEADGLISVTILEGEGYRIPSDSDARAVSQVRDNDAPRVSIRDAAGPGGAAVSNITEGEWFEFTVVSDLPVASDIEIKYELEELEGAFVNRNVEDRHIMRAGTDSLNVLIQTVDDEIDEANGTLIVTLLPGEGYNVDLSRQTRVQISDNDLIREISISAVSESLVEGESAQFELTASDTVYRQISISVSSSEGDFVSDASPDFVLMDETTSFVFEVPTDDDEIDEVDGNINVTLLESGGYTIDKESSSATVNVTDNDEYPTISITGAQYETVVEGSMIVFELTATSETQSIVNVTVNGSQEGLIASGSDSFEVDFDGQTSIFLEVETLKNDTLNENLTVEAIILPGSGYTVADAPDDRSIVAIVDDRILPEISIQAADVAITEGERAEFRLSATYPNYAEIAINVEVEDNFLENDNLPDSISFDYTDEEIFFIETTDDNSDEQDGLITVEILPNPDAYTIADDEASIAKTDVLDDDPPTLSIKSSVPYAVDGSSISFSVEAQSPVSESLSLSIEIRDGGDNEGKSHFQTVNISSGEVRSNVAVYHVPQQESYDYNRRVTAEVVSGAAGYRFTDRERLATVYLVGQSLPVISIEPVGSDPVEEGNPVNFRLSTLFVSNENVPVRIRVEDEGAEFISGVIDTTVILPAGEENVIFDIQIIDDLVDRDDAVITAILLNDGGYNLDLSYSDIVAQKTVLDNDVPTLSITAGETVVEGSGEQVSFEISSNIVRDERDLVVHYSVDQGVSNLIDLNPLVNGRDEVTLSSGDLTETVTITFDVIDDVIDENQGEIEVTLLLVDGDGEDIIDYALPPEQYVGSVTVVDDDVPVISVAGGDPVTEGDNVFAVYTVSSDIKRESRDLEIAYSIDTGSSLFLASTANASIVLPATPLADLANEGEPTEDDVVEIRLQIVNDRIDENDGSVATTILVTDSDIYTASGTANSAIVSVADDDVPVISIADGLPVVEGDDVFAVYAVTSDIKREARDLDIAFSIDTGSSNFLASTANASIVLSATPLADFEEEGEPNEDDQVEIRLQIVNDRIDENDGSITVAIVETDPSIYTADATADSASVSVADDDVPVISIAGGDPVTEGDNVFAVYTVSSDIKREARNLDIAYSIDTGTSNFLASTDNASIELTTTPTADLLNEGPPEAGDSVEIRLQIVNDRVDENEGSIRVAIVETDPSIYSANATADSASVSVADDDVPVISIAGGDSVTEGDNVFAVYTVSSDIKREARNLDIAYSIDTGTSNFLTSTDNASIELAATPTADLLNEGPPEAGDSVEIRLQIVNDRVDENEGSITVAIVETDQEIYTAAGEADSASVSVADDDVPVISIASGSSIIEGDNVFAVYTVSSNIKREARNLDIAYSIDTGTSNFLASTDNASITLVATPSADLSNEGPPEANDVVEIRLQIVNDRTDENDGSITVTILAADALLYTADAVAGSASVSVSDDDVPVISIASGPSVTEGDNVFAVYTVTSDVKRESKDLEITYSIDTGTGDFLASTANATITLTATTAADLLVAGSPGVGDKVDIRLQIVNDNVNENDGSVAVTIEETDTAVYTASTTAGTASVSVADDDAPELSLSLQTGHSGSITEGESITFDLEATNAPWQDITVSATLTPTTSSFLSNYSANGDGDIIVTGTISQGSTTGTLQVDTQSNNADENNGTVTVTLVNSTGYVLDLSDLTKHTVNFTVNDDDIPVVSISLSSTHSDGGVVESGTATFDISSSIPPWKDITVTAHLTPVDSVFLSGHTATDGTIAVTGTILATESTGTIAVTTAGNTAIDAAETTITATLVDGGGEYDVAQKASSAPAEDPDPSFATVVVRDDEAAPVISITGGSPVTEGTDAEFTVSAIVTRNVAMTINYTVSQGVSDDFIASTVELDSSVQLPAGDNTVSGTISIATAADSDDESDGTITVTLDGPETNQRQYMVSTTAGSAGVNVLDDDSGSVSPEIIPETLISLNEIEDATEPLNALNTGAAGVGSLPVVSISVESATIDEGGIIKLTVSADSVQNSDLAVSIIVNQGERSIIDDWIPASVTIESGRSESELMLYTLNDGLELADSEIVFSIRAMSHYELSESESSATVTVVDTENAERIARYQASNDTIIPETLTAMGENFVEALSSNVEIAFKIGLSNEFLMEIGGESSVQDILQYKAQDLNDSANSWASLLEDTSFHLPIEPSTEADATVTGWGSGNYTLISGDYDDEVSRSGELYTAGLGVDTVYRNGLLLGMSVNYFESDIEFSVGENSWHQDSAHRFQMTGLHPYLGWASEDRIVEMWTSVGYGQGGIEIEEADQNLETMDSTYHILAFGNSNRLYATEDSIFGGDSEYRLRSEAWTSSMNLTNGTGGLENADYSVHRIRIATEGTHSTTLVSETTVQTETSVGMRWDLGSDKQGLGFEMGANTTFQLPLGLTIEQGGRILMGRADLLKEWGVNGTVQYDRDLDSAGLQFTLTPTWGDTNNGSTQQIWESGVFDDELNQRTDEYEAEMDTELGYGFRFFDRSVTITPFGGINLRERGLHQYRLGNRVTAGENFNLTLESRYEPPIYVDEEAYREISVNGSFSW